MVVNNARNQIGGANLNKQEIEAFNAKLGSLCWYKNKSASEVRSLCSAVICK